MSLNFPLTWGFEAGRASGAGCAAWATTGAAVVVGTSFATWPELTTSSYSSLLDPVSISNDIARLSTSVAPSVTPGDILDASPDICGVCDASDSDVCPAGDVKKLAPEPARSDCGPAPGRSFFMESLSFSDPVVLIFS